MEKSKRRYWKIRPSSFLGPVEPLKARRPANLIKRDCLPGELDKQEAGNAA
jgi:hypothetical protein